MTTHRKQERNGCNKLEDEMEGKNLLPNVALEKTLVN